MDDLVKAQLVALAEKMEMLAVLCEQHEINFKVPGFMESGVYVLRRMRDEILKAVMDDSWESVNLQDVHMVLDVMEGAYSTHH